MQTVDQAKAIALAVLGCLEQESGYTHSASGEIWPDCLTLQVDYVTCPMCNEYIVADAGYVREFVDHWRENHSHGVVANSDDE